MKFAPFIDLCLAAHGYQRPPRIGEAVPVRIPAGPSLFALIARRWSK